MIPFRRIVSANGDWENEHWIFASDQVVRCVQRDFVEGSHGLAALERAGDADLHADETGGYDLSPQLISRSFTRFPGLVNKGTKGDGLSSES